MKFANPVEARRENRYRVHAVVKFTWQGAASEMETSIGRARDISSGGIFILTTQFLPLGTRVYLDVTLPGIRNREGARLTTTGSVIRTDGGGFAVAAQTRFGLRFHREDNQQNLQALPGVEPGAEGQGAVPAETFEAGTARFARLTK